MDPASIYLQAQQLRMLSRVTTQEWHRAARELHEQSDKAIIARIQTRRTLDEGLRLNELRRLSELRIYRQFAFFGQLVDGEVCDDPELLVELNASGCECGKCHRAESIAAVIRFRDLSSITAVCAACFQELTNLSLGQVI